MGQKLSSAFREFVGSFGDLGTLLPLTLGMIACNGISAKAALMFLGVAYILTGAYYRLPVPVQPLKATAMIAIATGASTGQVRAAAFWIACLMLAMGLTRLADRLNDIVPRVLVRGLQLGLGLMMVRTAWRMLVSYPQTLGAFTLGGPVVSESVRAAGFLPSGAEFWSALVLLVLPQIPLTLGNSVLATRDCAFQYFGRAGGRVTPRRLAMTIGLGNLAAGLVGGIPMCHGAGGMTAHYRLGARTGWYGLIIGSALLVAGVLAGRLTAGALAAIPALALGVPLAYVGVRHALLAADALRSPSSAVTVLSVGMVGYWTGNLLIGIVAGVISEIMLRRVAPWARRAVMVINHG